MPKQIEIKNERNKVVLWYLTEPEEWFLEKIQLSDFEIIKFKSISNSLMRRSFLAIRFLVRELGIAEIKYHQNGKPKIDGGHISISHSGNWLGISINEDGETGLDIEKISSRILKIKDRFLTEKEIQKICENSVEKMVLCWSAKEAVFKKHGGDTVFFKENMEVESLDNETKKISLAFRNSGILKTETLNYFYADKEYVVVHSL